MKGEDLIRAVSALAQILGYQLRTDGRLLNLKTGYLYDDVPENEKLRDALVRGDLAEMRRLLGVPTRDYAGAEEVAADRSAEAIVQAVVDSIRDNGTVAQAIRQVAR